MRNLKYIMALKFLKKFKWVIRTEPEPNSQTKMGNDPGAQRRRCILREGMNCNISVYGI